jgi:hypothetical protein
MESRNKKVTLLTPSLWKAQKKNDSLKNLLTERLKYLSKNESLAEETLQDSIYNIKTELYDIQNSTGNYTDNNQDKSNYELISLWNESNF